MYVCLCRAITDKQIQNAVDQGAGSLTEIRKCLGVADQCGKCASMASMIIKDQLNAKQAHKDHPNPDAATRFVTPPSATHQPCEHTKNYYEVAYTQNQ